MAFTSGGPQGPPLFLCPSGAGPHRKALTHPLRGKTSEDRQLLELLDPVAEAAGYEIVRLRLMGGTAARRLQIMGERADGTMLVEDCAQLARALNPVLDAADPVSGDYTLEVSSPGIDRPLTRLKDFETYEGLEARLEIDRLAEGRKRFKGELAGLEGNLVAINLEGEAETALLPFEWLVEARLVITDALMARGAAERAARLETAPAPDGDEAETTAAAPAPRAPRPIRKPKPPRRSPGTPSPGAALAGRPKD
jgi:ribosome maturation factor RimP